MRILFILLTICATALPNGSRAQTPLSGLDSANAALAWQAVGRLDTDKTGFCTATLIAPEVVLTAAHCVFGTETHQMLKADTLTFRAGLRSGASVADRKVIQIEVHPGYDASLGPTVANVRHDVALLRLARPIPTHILDPFLVQAAPLNKGTVSVVSYGRGRAEIASRQSQCRLFETYQDVVLMDCDATFGSSGAPVFSHKNGRAQIVSVISSIGSYQGKRTTYGMVLPKLVAELKQQMRANTAHPIANARRIKVGRDNRVRPAMSGAKFVRPGGS